MSLYLEDAAARTFDSMVVSESPRELVINTHAFLSKQRIIQAEVVRRAISTVLARDQDLSFSHVEAVLNLAADRASGKELHLPGPVLVRKSYERLIFGPLEEASPELPAPEPVIVSCPGRTPLPALGAELWAELCEYEPGKIEELRERPHPNEEWLDFDRIRPPLLVRTRADGDRFWPLGAPGAKKLSEFFIDEKVDPVVRTRAGILCDQDGPIWIMPLRIDERAKLRATTQRMLRVRFRPSGWREAAS
jgi:tRNA(Ile)-lysidine synthase